MHRAKIKGEMEMERVAIEVMEVSLLVTGGMLVNGDTSNNADTKDEAPPQVVSNDTNHEGSDKERDITHTLQRSYLHRARIEGEMEMERKVTEASLLATGETLVNEHTWSVVETEDEAPP